MTDTIINESKAEDQTRSKYLNPERRWVLGFALLVMLITTLPYLLGYWAQGETWRFTGFVFGVEDGNSYIAKMLRGAAGDFLFRTPFTAYHQEGVLAFPLYIILGKLTSPPGQHQQLIALYHLARILGGLLMIMATYDFIAVFVQKVPLRRWGVVLVSLGGGLGWLLLLFGRENWLGSLPLEFYSPESFGFLHLFGLPHLTFARALLLYGFIFYLNSDNIKNGLLAGLLWLLVGFFQPLNIVIAWAVTGIHIVFLGGVQLGKHIKTDSADWENFRSWLLKGLGAVAVSSPIVIYTMVAFGTDPVIKQWTSQNLIISPHPLHYLLAYGLILGLIALGIWSIKKTFRTQDLLLIGWVVILPFLVYAPYPLQRRLAEGFWVALISLLFLVYERTKLHTFRWSKLVLLLAFPSTLFLLAGSLLIANTPEKPLFRPADEVSAFNFLNEITDGEAIVLSSYETGNPMPAWAPVFVVIGHGPESIFLSELEPRVESFYQSQTPHKERWDLLAEFDVDYVFWGPAEQALGDFIPSSVAYLSSVYQNGDYEIYQVNLNGQ